MRAAGPPDAVLTEPKQLANLMTGLAMNRRYSFLSVGALGVVEMTAPGRVAKVAAGLKRLGVPADAYQYFTLHAALDVKHSREWNVEVMCSLTPGQLEQAAEGAYLRLWCGAACFAAYRRHFGLGPEYSI